MLTANKLFSEMQFVCWRMDFWREKKRKYQSEWYSEKFHLSFSVLCARAHTAGNCAYRLMKFYSSVLVSLLAFYFIFLCFTASANELFSVDNKNIRTEFLTMFGEKRTIAMENVWHCD